MIINDAEEKNNINIGFKVSTTKFINKEYHRVIK